MTEKDIATLLKELNDRFGRMEARAEADAEWKQDILAAVDDLGDELEEIKIAVTYGDDPDATDPHNVDYDEDSK